MAIRDLRESKKTFNEVEGAINEAKKLLEDANYIILTESEIEALEEKFKEKILAEKVEEVIEGLKDLGYTVLSEEELDEVSREFEAEIRKKIEKELEEELEELVSEGVIEIKEACKKKKTEEEDDNDEDDVEDMENEEEEKEKEKKESLDLVERLLSETFEETNIENEETGSLIDRLL